MTRSWFLVVAAVVGCLLAGAAYFVYAGRETRRAVTAYHDYDLSEWLPVPQRMRTGAVAAVFEHLPVCHPVKSDRPLDNQAVLEALDRIEAEHKNDQDMLVLAAYVRADIYWRALMWTGTLTGCRKAAAQLLGLAKRDPKRYNYFEECARSFSAACDIRTPPATVGHTDKRLAELMKTEPHSNAVMFSVRAATRVVAESEGDAAAAAFLRRFAGEHPGTWAAFWSWDMVALFCIKQRAWDDLDAADQQVMATAERMHDPAAVILARQGSKMHKAIRLRDKATARP